jgi:hypothetical protein
VKSFCVALSFCASALLTACGALRQAQNDVQPPIGLPGASPQSPTTRVAARPAAAQAGNSGQFLYVGGAKLSMYALGSSKPLHSVKVNDYVSSAEVALDLHGHLCMSNGDISYAQLFEVDARTLKIVREVHGVGAYPALLADRRGYLYASTGGGDIEVYAPGCTHRVNVIRRGVDVVGRMVFDRSGNLYAAMQPHYAVSVYAPTKRPGHMRLVRQIRDGLSRPLALAIGPSDDLFVANWNYSTKDAHITVYRPGGSRPVRITKSIKAPPSALAVDSKGRLYAAIPNYPVPSGWISVYAPGGSQPVRKVRVYDPVSLAVDPSDNLYVVNLQRQNSVLVYSPGATKLLLKITDGINIASGLVIGSP